MFPFTFLYGTVVDHWTSGRALSGEYWFHLFYYSFTIPFVANAILNKIDELRWKRKLYMLYRENEEKRQTALLLDNMYHLSSDEEDENNDENEKRIEAPIVENREQFSSVCRRIARLWRKNNNDDDNDNNNKVQKKKNDCYFSRDNRNGSTNDNDSNDGDDDDYSNNDNNRVDDDEEDDDDDEANKNMFKVAPDDYNSRLIHRMKNPYYSTKKSKTPPSCSYNKETRREQHSEGMIKRKAKLFPDAKQPKFMVAIVESNEKIRR